MRVCRWFSFGVHTRCAAAVATATEIATNACYIAKVEWLKCGKEILQCVERKWWLIEFSDDGVRSCSDCDAASCFSPPTIEKKAFYKDFGITIHRPFTHLKLIVDVKRGQKKNQINYYYLTGMQMVMGPGSITIQSITVEPVNVKQRLIIASIKIPTQFPPHAPHTLLILAIHQQKKKKKILTFLSLRLSKFFLFHLCTAHKFAARHKKNFANYSNYTI